MKTTVNIVETWQSQTHAPTVERKSRMLGWLIFALAVDLALIFLVASVEPALSFMRKLIGVTHVELPTLSATQRGVALFDRYDRHLCTLQQAQDRAPVPLDKISINVRNAVVAAEDRRFLNHLGIDLRGIARAYVSNYKAGSVVQGGSTITQQLVRNLHLDKNDKSFKRKIKEVVLAIDVDRRYSKEKILETYLNVVYFGGGVYGVERAAQHYFNKNAQDLTIPESAFLAAVLKAPTILGSQHNRKSSLARTQVVIDSMAESGFISPAVAQTLDSSSLTFEPGPAPVPYPYYTGYVMQELKRKLGNDLWTRGWKVYTNLDVEAQRIAERKLTEGISRAPHGIDQGALVSMSVKDASVYALVGGAGKHDASPWNRALFPHTVGSSFKPFVYLAALIDGVIQPDTIIDDGPFVINTGRTTPKYAPRNYDGKHHGWLTVRQALASSSNICATRLAMKVGLKRVIKVASDAGITANLKPYPSLAIGAGAISPLNMTTAYATLARGGNFIKPQFLRRIESDDGDTTIELTSTSSARLPSEAVAQLVDVMQDVVRFGTGSKARLPGIPVAGKTGTADNGRDIWFIGFTPDMVTGVWAGNDKNMPVNSKHATGGNVMCSIWRDYMVSYYRIRKYPTELAFAPPAKPLMRTNNSQDQERLAYRTIGRGGVAQARRLAVRAIQRN